MLGELGDPRHSSGKDRTKGEKSDEWPAESIGEILLHRDRENGSCPTYIEESLGTDAHAGGNGFRKATNRRNKKRIWRFIVSILLVFHDRYHGVNESWEDIPGSF